MAMQLLPGQGASKTFNAQAPPPKFTTPEDPVTSPGQLLPGQHPLDETTQGLINKQLTRATMPDEQRQAEMMQGVARAGQGVLPTGQSTQEAENPLAMSSPQSIGDVFEKRAARDYGSNLRNLQRNVEFQGQKEKAGELQTGGNILAKQEQLKTTMFNQQMEHYKQLQTLKIAQDKERGDVLGSLLGLIGQVGGTIAGAL